jgi:class 3 adenylate cyclase/tetratricopeptide (TPR) repeat protein
MNCGSCGAENAPGARFCSDCGSRLSVACAACGSTNGPTARFCSECGSPLAQGASAAVASRVPGQAASSPAPPQAPPGPARHDGPLAERRLVSVLFADLVGFTPFAEGRDAEEVRETLSRYFDLASEVIRRYGGVVEKFIGDAVMALWGAPTAHEDDPERAVRAAMDLLGAVSVLGPGITARAGVLTGEAAVTLGATNQGMVAGDLVNTASRLQAAAPEGVVLVGEATMRAASGGIVFEAAGEQLLKGKAAPVPAWRALRVVAEVGGRNRSDVLEAPFVGRDEEMRLIKDLFHASERERRVRLISVIGPAGIGKSRLAWELEKYIDGLADEVLWHRGRSPSYGQGITFWAVGEMVRSRCGLLESDDEQTSRRKGSEAVARVMPEGEERRWVEASLLALLGVGERTIAAEQLFAAWRTFFERLAASAPLLMVFEDLHWADTGTLDFIDHLLDWSRGLPITVVTLARPELIERRRDWGAGKRHFTSLFLEPLTEAAMRQLLAGLVPGLPESAVRSIVARADGMPLYAVETVRMLLAQGRLQEADGAYHPVGDLSELAVPETLTALIASRLDALEPADRALLQEASVLGQSFTVASLVAVGAGEATDLEGRLHGLVRRELLRLEADPLSPERGQFAFVQALIREVAYNTLARKDRRDKHLAAARWLEGVGSDELAGALAGHYLAAWQNTPEGPEADALAAQARLALVGAAERATGLGGLDQALDFLGQALSVTREPSDRMDLLDRAAQAAERLGRYAETTALGRDALRLAEETGDLVGRARAVRRIASGLTSNREVDEAMALVEETLRDLAGLRSEPDVLELERMYASGLAELGDRPRALSLLDSVLETAERGEMEAIVLKTLERKGTTLCDIGRFTEGLALLEAAARLATELGLEDLALNARGNLAVYSGDIDPRRSFEAMRSLADQARRAGQRGNLVVNLANAAELAIHIGDWEWASSQLAAALTDDIEGVDRIQLLEWPIVLAAYRGEDVSAMLAEHEAVASASPGLEDILLERRAAEAFAAGRLGEARSLWQRYASVSPLNAPIAQTKAGRTALWMADADGAQADLDALVATGARGRWPKTSRRTLEAGVAALSGQLAEARVAYREALRGWRDIGFAWDEALTGLDLVATLGPSDPEAGPAAERTRQVFAEVGARPFLARLEALLAADDGPRTGAEDSGDRAAARPAALADQRR